jgi:hypothetical protein
MGMPLAFVTLWYLRNGKLRQWRDKRISQTKQKKEMVAVKANVSMLDFWMS